MSKYRVFKRTWWKRNKTCPDGLEPHCGKKTTLRIVDSIEEARCFCEVFNKQEYIRKHPLSLKAEFESI